MLAKSSECSISAEIVSSCIRAKATGVFGHSLYKFVAKIDDIIIDFHFTITLILFTDFMDTIETMCSIPKDGLFVHWVRTLTDEDVLHHMGFDANAVPFIAPLARQVLAAKVHCLNQISFFCTKSKCQKKGGIIISLFYYS